MSPRKEWRTGERHNVRMVINETAALLKYAERVTEILTHL